VTSCSSQIQPPYQKRWITVDTRWTQGS